MRCNLFEDGKPVLIIFDLDGTLTIFPEINRYFDKLIIETIKNLNMEMPPFEQRVMLWKSGRDYLDVLKGWGLKSKDEIRLFWDEFDKNDAKNRFKLIREGVIKLQPGVIKVLDKISGDSDIELAILTNSHQSLSEEMLEYFGIRKYFKYIKGLSPGKPPDELKPEIGGLKEILSFFDIYSERDRLKTYLVGDSWPDILTAFRGGIRGVLYNPEGKALKEIMKNSYELYTKQLIESGYSFMEIASFDEILCSLGQSY